MYYDLLIVSVMRQLSKLIPKRLSLDYNKVMIGARKGLVQVLTFLLLVSLLGGALAFSANVALSHPTKLEGWLKDSGLNEHFVDNAVTQAQKSASKGAGGSGVSGDDQVVKQSVESAFPPQLLQQSVNTFVDSNYAWLQGKTSKPEFVIDLTAARQTYAQKIGMYAETRLAGLPACTALQQAQLSNPAGVDALSIRCRPPGLNPMVAGKQVTQKIIDSDSFLSKPVLTAQTINPKDDKGGSQPYYLKLAKAPQAYQLGQKLPLLLGIVALISTLGIVLIAPTRRKGVQRIGVVLLIAGIILLAITALASTVSTKIEQRVFNTSTTGELQKSLEEFAHRVQHQIVGTELYFGIAFLLLGAIILGYLFVTRHETNTSASPVSAEAPGASATTSLPSVPIITPRARPRVIDMMVPRPKLKPVGPPPLKPLKKPAATLGVKKPSRALRRPRLIQ